MNLCILHGSIQTNSNSSRTVAAIQSEASLQGISSSIVSLTDFNTLFIGEYIFYSNASDRQLVELQKMREANAIIFVVPTYYKTMPGALKNFFDLVREPSVYAHKTISFVSSNHKNQDFGARNAQLTIQGIIEFHDTQAAIVPEIVIIDPDHIDQTMTKRAICLIEAQSASYLAMN